MGSSETRLTIIRPLTTDHLTSHLGPQLLVWEGGGGGQGEGDQERGEAEAGAHLRAED